MKGEKFIELFEGRYQEYCCYQPGTVLGVIGTRLVDGEGHMDGVRQVVDVRLPDGTVGLLYMEGQLHDPEDSFDDAAERVAADLALRPEDVRQEIIRAGV